MGQWECRLELFHEGSFCDRSQRFHIWYDSMIDEIVILFSSFKGSLDFHYRFMEWELRGVENSFGFS